ncbi:MAG: RiPP maturation radical SAM C-methyltransferase [Thermodesulfobacteriota bacterium]
MFRIALISMPWPLFNRPSIQLGALKSYLAAQDDALDISTYPVYLEVAARIGFELYHEISKHSWITEAIYASLLFPEKNTSIHSLINKQKRSKKYKLHFDLSTLKSKLSDHHETFMRSRDWRQYNLIGFSICLNQFTSSLYAIRTLKARFPEIAVVVGGSSCSGEMGRAVLSSLPEIDFVVSGEGEKPLLSIVRLLKGEVNKPGPGVFYRNSQGMVSGGGYDEIDDLSALPPPDYEDYFNLLKDVSPQIPFLPVLPVEFSRGCWWRKCRFCNLNLQWHSYRKKSVHQIVEEIKKLTDRYASIDLAFTDNALPPRQGTEIFTALTALGKDLDIFAELRAGQPAQSLALMHEGGLKTVQIGIEALSSSLLKRMGKGTTALQNIETMRHCEELGIIQSGNLITLFPGSTSDEVKETMEALDFVWPFYPLKITPFWLGYGSPVFCNARESGIKQTGNHHLYKSFLSGDLFSRLILTHQAYRGDRSRQHTLWRPVAKKVERWRKDYLLLRSRYPSQPLLSYRDGEKFLGIRQIRSDGSVQIHRLHGPSRSVYLYCTTIRSLKDIKERFPGCSLESLQKFFNELVQKRIMLKENDRYLSLAVRERGLRD